MSVRGLAGVAIAFLVFSAAHAAPDGSLAAAVLACSAQQDEAAQLACYNRIAAQLKAAAPSAPPAAIAAVPAPPPTPPRADTATDFGKEAMPFQADAPTSLDQQTARVADVTYNYFRIFTVTLDNGQVWRQVDGDSRLARFKNDKTEVVTITRGFLDSFHLAIQGVWGDYAVKRIK